MSTLLGFVIFYLVVSIAIGLIAATRVHNSRDFAVAGRHLPLPIVTATVFATWFGAETVLGISATFVKDGLGAVVADPFGSSLCLIIAGLFFASRLYRMNLLTIGDYYRVRYNRGVEVLCTLAIVASYLGWVVPGPLLEAGQQSGGPRRDHRRILDLDRARIVWRRLYGRMAAAARRLPRSGGCDGARLARAPCHGPERRVSTVVSIRSDTALCLVTPDLIAR